MGNRMMPPTPLACEGANKNLIPRQLFYPDLYRNIPGYVTVRVIQGYPAIIQV